MIKERRKEIVWTGVEKCLPDEESSCLVKYKNGEQGESFFWGEEGFDPYADPLGVMVTHWMYDHEWEHSDPYLSSCKNCGCHRVFEMMIVNRKPDDFYKYKGRWEMSWTAKQPQCTGTLNKP